MKTEKMCFVIVTKHSWLFLEKKSCFLSLLFAQLQSIKILIFALIIPRQWVNPPLRCHGNVFRINEAIT